MEQIIRGFYGKPPVKPCVIFVADSWYARKDSKIAEHTYRPEYLVDGVHMNELDVDDIIKSPIYIKSLEDLQELL